MIWQEKKSYKVTLNEISSNTVIYVKDSVAKKFVEDRLSEVGKSNQVIALN